MIYLLRTEGPGTLSLIAFDEGGEQLDGHIVKAVDDDLEAAEAEARAKLEERLGVDDYTVVEGDDERLLNAFKRRPGPQLAAATPSLIASKRKDKK